jgi:HK97 family phage prohead protease
MPNLRAKRYLRLASGETTGVSAAPRTIAFTFSTSDVASDGHRILPGAWESRGHNGLADFRNNPVFLWSHNVAQPPIGNVTRIGEQNGELSGFVQFADHDFADCIFQLFRDGFLRGASVSFEPLDWNYATGPTRAQGALDFTRVKLWEISAVTLPADAGALAKAADRGVIPSRFVRRLRSTKVYLAEEAARDLRGRKARARLRKVQLMMEQPRVAL